MWRFSLPLLLIFAVSGLPVLAQQTSNITRQEKAAALGAHLASQVRSRTDTVGIPAVDGYLAALGQRLAAGFPNGPAHWEFTLVKQTGGRTHEALALPGGYVFIPARLIASVESEDEFAAMLAHAMAKAASPDLLTWSTAQMASLPLLFVNLRLDGDGSALVPLSLQATQEVHEMEADTAAVQMLPAVGFDPKALLVYLERVQARNTAPVKREAEAEAARLPRLRQALAGLTTETVRHSSSASFLDIQEQVRDAERSVMTSAKVPSLLSPSK